jgi:small-conductance mechanosensitive channel
MRPGARRGAALAAALLLCSWPPTCDAGRLLAQEPLPPEAEIETAPVELDGQVLFRVRGASSMPAERRAAGIAMRIERVAADPSIPVNALKVSQSGGLDWIVAGDRPLVAVTDADARLEQLSSSELALAHLMRIQQAIGEYRQARSPEAVRRNLRDTAGATLAFVAGVALVLALTRWLHRLIQRRAEKLTQRVEAATATTDIRTLAVPRAERVVAALHQALRLLSGSVLLIIGFEFLSFVLGLFPGTRYLANNLLGLVVGPLSTMGHAAIGQLPNVVFLAVLFLVLRVVLRLLRVVFDALQRGTVRLSGFEREWAQPTYRIVRFALVAFGVVVAYPYLPGSQTAAFKGVSLFVGVLLSLGSSSAVANLVAGYSLIYRRVFREGDRVKIGEVIGDVTESRIQVTRLRSLKNEEVIIPNSTILTGQVVNYSALARRDGLILHTEVGIGYETSWRQVEAMLLAAADRTPGILRRPAPFVLQNRLADFAVIYELNVYCADAGTMLEVYTDLHRQILDVFNEYGVQIMTPAYMADPAAPKVVPPGQWYAAPAAAVGDRVAASTTSRPRA